MPSPTPILAKRAFNSTSVGWVGANCRRLFRHAEELQRLLLLHRQRLEEVSGRGFGSGLAEKRRERLHLVAGLHLLDVLEVARVEKLGAEGGIPQRGFHGEDLLDALGRLALPASRPEIMKLPASLPVMRVPNMS